MMVSGADSGVSSNAPGMSIYATTFPQDFLKTYFSTGGACAPSSPIP